MGVRRLKALAVGLSAAASGAGGQRKRPQLLFIDDVLVQRDDKFGTLGVDAVDADLAAHQLHQLLDNAQPQAGSLDQAVPLLVHSLEGVENIGNVFLSHALPRILHRVPHPHPVDRLALAPDGECDRALAGILHRVIQQVNQNLLDPHLVSAEHTGNGGIHMELELQPLFPCLDPDHIDDL